MFNTTLNTVATIKQQMLNIEFLFLDLESCTRLYRHPSKLGKGAANCGGFTSGYPDSRGFIKSRATLSSIITVRSGRPHACLRH